MNMNPFIKIYLFILLISTIFLYIVSDNKWLNLKQELNIELTYINKLVSKSVSDQFEQQESMLKILGNQIIKLGVDDNKEKIENILNELLIDNSGFVAYGLSTPDGQLIITSANIRSKKLPNLLMNPKSSESFKETLNSDSLTLGRTYFFKPLDRWVLPLRYSLRDESGKVVYVISTGISLESHSNPWMLEDLKNGIYIGITKDKNTDNEYYTQYTDLFLPNRDIDETYTKPFIKELSDKIPKAIFDSSGMSLSQFKNSNKTIFYETYTQNYGGICESISYNKKFKLFTSIGQDFDYLIDEFHEALVKYFLLYILFNIILFFLFKYIYKIEKKSKDRLEYNSTHDKLTGLYNRHYLQQYFPKWQSKHMDGYSLLYLDLDNFKKINDFHGHLVGDKVLIEVSKRLNNFSNDDVTLYKHGGDEFVILFPETEKSKLVNFIEQLTYQIKNKIHVDNLEFIVNTSIGVACSEDSSIEYHELLRQADLAVYEAKKERNSFIIFNDKLQKENNKVMAIEDALLVSLEKSQMHVVYQPQIDANNASIIGVEALIRWKEPSLGNISPEVFIPISESNGMINSIGDFVIEESFKEINQLQDSIQKTIRLSINVSVKQLLNVDFRETLNKKASYYNLQPSNIVIEITENIFIEDIDGIKSLLILLNDDGFDISLDDFGTGYSSLSVLSKMPISEIKIDKSFIRDILIDDQDKALIESILSIGKTLKVPTLAEGVEELEHVKVLESFGCNSFQGYYFAKPMKIEALQEYISNYTPYK